MLWAIALDTLLHPDFPSPVFLGSGLVQGQDGLCLHTGWGRGGEGHQSGHFPLNSQDPDEPWTLLSPWQGAEMNGELGSARLF